MSDTLSVLIVGSGGREHALAESALRSPRCGRLLVTPGNAGTPGDRFNVAADDVAGIVALCQTEKVDLVLVGPEAPLAIANAPLACAAVRGRHVHPHRLRQSSTAGAGPAKFPA